MLSIIGGLAALVDWREALAVRIIGPIELRFMLFGAALYAFGVLINFLHFKFFQNDSKAEDEIILPEKQNDYFLWVLLCLVAALSEEFVYRGVLTHLLAKHGMLFILAAMMSAVSFFIFTLHAGLVGYPHYLFIRPGVPISVSFEWQYPASDHRTFLLQYHHRTFETLTHWAGNFF
ncbi:MAG: CPBP family intramembrane metalloprotease [Saprospiraceae bacterium]|nr:CPBP family intramembrane metalloprotease [Saprospiraceae bacterium]